MPVDDRLIVRAIIPDHALNAFIANEYAAWYVGHVNERALDDKTLWTEFNNFVARNRVTDPDYDPEKHVDLTDDFFYYLESNGYTVFHSRHDGLWLIPVTCKDEDGGD